MCFSASASFGAGIVLSVISVASIIKVQSPSQVAFASIPLIFCIQQNIEGILWLIIPGQEYAVLQSICTHAFIFLAQILWPVWVPFALMKLEKNKKRRKIQQGMFWTGCLLALYLSYCLLTFHVEATIDGYHISYKQDYPKPFSHNIGLVYILVTIAPHFVSTVWRMWILGSVILISYVITTVLYVDYIVSVWCFFASVISLAVLAIMNEISRPDETFPEVTDDAEKVIVS